MFQLKYSSFRGWRLLSDLAVATFVGFMMWCGVWIGEAPLGRVVIPLIGYIVVGLPIVATLVRAVSRHSPNCMIVCSLALCGGSVALGAINYRLSILQARAELPAVRRALERYYAANGVYPSRLADISEASGLGRLLLHPPFLRYESLGSRYCILLQDGIDEYEATNTEPLFRIGK